MFLFDEYNELREAYEFEINFHNQLKAKLLNDKIVTQIIRESTIAYNKIWSNPEKIKYFINVSAKEGRILYGK